MIQVAFLFRAGKQAQAFVVINLLGANKAQRVEVISERISLAEQRRVAQAVALSRMSTTSIVQWALLDGFLRS